MAVGSFGFRGEALPSIASVSRTTLSTGDTDGLRHIVSVDGGEVAEPKAGAGPKGTTVTVEDLFHNTPARLKFLKTDATEVAAVVDVVPSSSPPHTVSPNATVNINARRLMSIFPQDMAPMLAHGEGSGWSERRSLLRGPRRFPF